MAINYQGGDDVVITSAFQPMMRTMLMNYENQLKRQQEEAKQREAIRKKASEDFAKINAGGLWKADLPEFNEYYNAVKESYHKINTTKDPDELRRFSMEFETNKNRLNSLIEQSRKMGEDFVKAERDILSNSSKIDVEKARANLNIFLEKPSSEIEAGAFTNAISSALKKYDYDKEMSSYRQLGTSFAKNDANFIKTDTDTPEQLGGNRFVTRVTSYTPNQNAVFEAVSNFFKSKPERQYMLQDYMESKGITDENEAIMSFANENNIFARPSRTERINANERRGITINMPNPFGSNTEKEASIERNAKVFTFRDKNGKIIGEYIAPSAMALNKTQSLHGVIEGVDPYTGERVRIDNPKDAEIFGIFENNKGRKLLQIRYKDEFGFEQVIISPNVQRINRAELSKKELQYLQGYEADVTERRSQQSTKTTRGSQGSTNTNNKQKKEKLYW